MQNSKLIDTTLSVLSWNLWWQFGPHKKRYPAIVSTLKKLDVDIIGLQEVWDDGQNNLAAMLASELGYHHAFVPGARPNGIHMGNAILSRWPILRTDQVSLYDQANAPELRVALFAELDGPRGKIPAFCTHLNWHKEHSHIRQKQIGDLTRFIDRKRPWKFPPVLCGDFNADPGAEEIRMLNGLTTCPVENLVFHDAWDFAGDGGPGHTWAKSNPYTLDTLEQDRRIDYVFVGGPRASGLGHIVDCQIAADSSENGVWPSDHFAVSAKLRY